MASLLKSLSAALIVAGVGSYVLLHDPDASKLRRAVDNVIGQGRMAPQPGPVAKFAQAKLPFIVIEPRDFAAPAAGTAMQPTPQIQPPEPPLAELHLSSGDSQSTMDLNPVEARLRARLPADLIEYFDLFLYVSKATSDKGVWAQHMFVLAKQKDQPQTFALLHDWPVSTGLEEPIPAPSGKLTETNTPQGVFKLDRDRFHEDYTSNEWQSPMPYAMFFDWQVDGRTSGLAIHGTDAEGEKVLGERASHGCIRLSPENARTLFELIQTNYRGRVPEFQVNPDSGTMSTTGALVRDENGNVKMTYGYKALVFIEDFGGPSVDTVAALY